MDIRKLFNQYTKTANIDNITKFIHCVIERKIKLMSNLLKNIIYSMSQKIDIHYDC